jgi:polysaccharide deacetylase family protein (PEP-CTERM system associated)
VTATRGAEAERLGERGDPATGPDGARSDMAPSRAPRLNILSVDVEDWFHILEVDGTYGREAWGSLESRVARNTERLLGILAEERANATFFVVGWVAERHPGLVRRICDAGHEVASHTYWHEVLHRHDRRSLSADLARSKQILEEISGRAVQGFRAPGGSISRRTAWAFDLISAAGFSYDSSVWPSVGSHGGLHMPFRGPYRIRTNRGDLDEIPASTLGLGRLQIPYAGGGWLRLLPLALIRLGLWMDARAARPTNVYVHPREIDPGQPRMDLPPLRRFKYYVGLGRAEGKLRAILRTGRFVSARSWLETCGRDLAARVVDMREAARTSESSIVPSALPPPPPEATAPTA